MSFRVTLRGQGSGDVDPEVRTLLAELAAANRDGDSGPEPRSPQALRLIPDPLLAHGPPSDGSCEVIDLTVAGECEEPLPVRIYRPASIGPLPVVTFFHGGCWVFCSLDTHDSICRYLCERGVFLVVSVGYRLAPEARFPAAIDDAYRATRWVAENCSSFGGDPQRLAVAGDSAGGNIAAVVCAMARERALPHIDGQLLMYPITDISKQDTPSHARYGTDFFFEAAFFYWACDLYVRNVQDRRDPRVSPLLIDDASGLPAALIQTAEFDILRDEGEGYAALLHNAGVPVQCVRYRGMVHAFIAMAGRVALGRRALDDGIRFLRGLWNGAARRVI